jgi:tritrans,polycis-undecaprenyl-diphosphate synthase [geranylgeranyl-diphosphate specific]
MHVGIILDGNRRYAKKLGKSLLEGHKKGAEIVEELFNWCLDLDIKELTLYCFSTENFNRSKKEVNFLMQLFEKEFQRLLKDNRITENKIKLRFIGDKERLNKKLQQLTKELEEKTKNYNNFIINFAVAYSGKQEILSAIKKLVKEKKEINEKNFEDCLWLKESPDFIIRTSGERRTSNFLPWQSAYSEWIFLDKMWPEMTKQDLAKAIQEFNKRERRFGK